MKKISFSLKELVILLLICLLLIFVLGLSTIILLLVLPILVLYFFLDLVIKDKKARRIVWILYFIILFYLVFSRII